MTEIAECYINTNHTIGSLAMELNVGPSRVQEILRVCNVSNKDKVSPNVNQYK